MKTNVTKTIPSTKKTEIKNPVLKFRIAEILNQKTHLTYKFLKRNLPNALNITRQTFATYLNATIDSNVEIPASKIFLLSKYLNVEIYDLYNKDYFNKIANKNIEIFNEINQADYNLIK